jgi:hypothetical protein
MAGALPGRSYSQFICPAPDPARFVEAGFGFECPVPYDPAKYLNVGVSGSRLLQDQNADGIMRTFALLPSQEMRIGDVVLPPKSFATLLIANHDGSTREVDGLLPTGLFRSVYIGYADRFVVLVPW